MSARRSARVDLSVYLIVGPEATRGRAVHDVVAAAVDGGATAVQLRWKDAPARAFVEEARRLVSLLRPRGVPLIVNDRVDVAIAAGADGIHVGQEDMAPADARRMVGPDMLLGLSITCRDDVAGLDPAIVDYAGVGPVFATPSKADATPPLGLAETAAITRALGVPAVAIGGIGIANARHVLDTGVEGLAVISAICGADDPRGAAAALAACRRTPRPQRA